MKPTRTAVLAAPLALALAACGGPAGSTSSPTSFGGATPAYSALSMDLTAADRTTPSFESVQTSSSALTAAAATPAAPECHPHLFLRTADVVARVNRHLWRALRHAERVIARNPSLATGAEQVWEHVDGGIDRKFTMTRTGDVYTWKLELAKAGGAFSTVLTGSIDRSQAQSAHEGTGELSIDLSALASVTGEEVAGTLDAKFTSLGSERKVVVDAQDVVWDTDANAALVRAPRDARYVYDRQPGKGGSLKIQEQMVFGCPANPSLAAVDVKLVSRWYRTAGGSVHGRSDALMTSGQLPASRQIVGLTCHASPAEDGDQAESYWLLKLEDLGSATPGDTVVGGAHESGDVGASACDPAYGPVPTPTDASKDFAFGAIDFGSPDALPFLPNG